MLPSKPLSVDSEQKTQQKTTKSQEDVGFDNQSQGNRKKTNGDIDAVASVDVGIQDRIYSSQTPVKVEHAHESDKSAP